MYSRDGEGYGGLRSLLFHQQRVESADARAMGSVKYIESSRRWLHRQVLVFSDGVEKTTKTKIGGGGGILCHMLHAVLVGPQAFLHPCKPGNIWKIAVLFLLARCWV